MSEESIGVVVADASAVVRAGLQTLLEDASFIEVMGEARCKEEALTLVGRLEPDMLVADPYGIGCDASALVEWVGARCPATKVVLFTDEPVPSEALRALRSGAAGCMTKSAGQHELVDVLAQAANRGNAISPRVAYHMLAQGGGSGRTPLSAREKEIITCIGQGMTNRQISEHLFLSEATVKTYTKRLFRKLDVGNRSEAVRVALENGLIQTVPDP